MFVLRHHVEQAQRQVAGEACALRAPANGEAARAVAAERALEDQRLFQREGQVDVGKQRVDVIQEWTR